MKTPKIVIPGGAGLVGHNLVAQLLRQGYSHLVVLDKHRENLAVLQRLHPSITAEYADLAQPGDWGRHFAQADVVVMLQAQIGGTEAAPFVRNNLDSTAHILARVQAEQIAYTVHISSSVVQSVADDHYSRTKRAQEAMVSASGIPCVVLRPTLMFGWFDRKHLGWLSRFMHKVPVFPIPGTGRYMRQPLYVADFCRIIIACIAQRDGQQRGQVFNISGLEQLNYIDIIRHIKAATRARTAIVKIPYHLFAALLTVWAWFDRNPPFTTAQLKALVAPDAFEVIDWPGIFGVRATPFAQAIEETFNDPVYSHVALEF